MATISRVSRKSDLYHPGPGLKLQTHLGHIDYIRLQEIPSKVTIVCMQATPGSRWEFHPLMERLSKRFETIAFSHPGHAHSTKTRNFHFHYIDMAINLLEFLEGLNFDPWHSIFLVTHSASAEVALLAKMILDKKIVDYPFDIKGIVGISPMIPTILHCRKRETSWNWIDTITSLPWVGYLFTRYVRILLRRLLKKGKEYSRLFADAENQRLEAYKRGNESLFMNGNQIKNEVSRMVATMRRTQRIVWQRKNRYRKQSIRRFGEVPLKLPFLYLFPKNDRIIYPKYFNRLMRETSYVNHNCRFSWHHSAGHMVHVEDPEWTEKCVVQFLEELGFDNES